MKSAEIFKTLKEIDKLFEEHQYGIGSRKKFDSELIIDEYLFNDGIELLKSNKIDCRRSCDDCLLHSFSLNFCLLLKFSDLIRSQLIDINEEEGREIMAKRKHLAELFIKYRETIKGNKLKEKNED